MSKTQDIMNMFVANQQSGDRDYVKKTGDTMTGELFINSGTLTPIHLRGNYNGGSANGITSHVYQEIRGIGKDNVRFGHLRFSSYPSGDKSAELSVVDHADKPHNTLQVAIRNDNSIYMSGCNPEENSYTSQFDTLQASINRHVIKSTSNINIFVGGSNSSDTADLFKGRGGSAELPFATLGAAANYACLHYMGYNASVLFWLQSDMTLTSHMNLYLPLFGSCFIRSIGSTIYTINFSSNGGIYQYGGKMELSSIKLAATDKIGAFVILDDMAKCTFGTNLTFSGTVYNTVALNHNSILNAKQSYTGSVTGNRYVANTGSIIDSGGKGANVIPGSTAGVLDSTSHYI